MVNVKNKMFVSTRNYDYEEQVIENVASKCQNYFALTLNSRSKVYSFVPIEQIESRKYTGEVYELVFENCYGRQYCLEVTSDCEFITKRGVVAANKINDLDVFIDKEDLLCKMVSKTAIQSTGQFADVSIQYTSNYFCNGILIKGKI